MALLVSEEVSPGLVRPAVRQHARVLVGMAVTGACLLIWFWRRPEQLLHPYVWADEVQVLSRYVERGWWAAVQPTNGSLCMPTTVLVVLAATISFAHLPVIALAMAAGVFALTVWILVVPESRWGNLPARSAMAVGLALCPIDPELFGVLLYSFWYASLWPVIILGWTRDHWRARVPLLAVASLSTPAAGLITLPFAMSWWFRRRRADLVSAGILAVGGIIELAVFLRSSRPGATPTDWLRTVRHMVRSVGLFVTGGLRLADGQQLLVEFVGLVLAGGLVVGAFMLWDRHRRGEALLLVVALGLVSFASAVPAPLVAHPVLAGPRYFLLPFTVMIWLLIHLTTQSGVPEGGRRVAVGALIAGALGLTACFSRPPQTIVGRLDWQEELEACAASPDPVVDVPIYFDGSLEMLWGMAMTPDDCRARL